MHIALALSWSLSCVAMLNNLKNKTANSTQITGEVMMVCLTLAMEKALLLVSGRRMLLYRVMLLSVSSGMSLSAVSRAAAEGVFMGVFKAKSSALKA